MRLTRWVRAFGLCAGLAASGLVVGCGAQSQQPALDKEDESGMLVEREGMRKFQKQLREQAKTGTGNRKKIKPQVKAEP